ncbi:MAG: hypothetical protein CSA45_06130 [Gammaproteobacteria bacterium]|nr:MAG: hypothetical protein CSA45_06130 [Gammaproteobacteria bacterium]
MTQRHLLSAVFLGLSAAWLSACTLTAAQPPAITDDMQLLALCRSSAQSVSLESKIRAEYGFKRFAKNTYRPIVEQRLFGHEVRVIEITGTGNKLYVAGNPLEFGHHFKTRLLPELACESNTCQAPLGNGQSLFIYKINQKKAKDTTVIECTKMHPNK